MREINGKSQFAHVGLTVKDISSTAAFYEKYFGFKITEQGAFPPGFFEAKPTLYKLQDGVLCNYAFITSPDGVTMELFEFDPQIPQEDAIWNMPGYHHICLYVADLQAVYEAMKADGLELNYFFEPDNMDPAGEHHWVFLRDPDGNMIELQD